MQFITKDGKRDLEAEKGVQLALKAIVRRVWLSATRSERKAIIKRERAFRATKEVA